MKSSPYENNPYTSSSEAPTQPLPPAPSLPAGRGEAVLALLLALLAAFTANSLLYGGLALGSALGIFGIFTVTALYLLIKSKHFGWYPLSCLAFSLILVASFARSSDGFVKFCLLLLALTAYFLGLSQIVWAPLYPAGPSAFSEWGGTGPVPCPLSTDLPRCARSLCKADPGRNPAAAGGRRIAGPASGHSGPGHHPPLARPVRCRV